MIDPIVCQIDDFHAFDRVSKRYTSLEFKYGWKSNTAKNYDFGHWNKLLLAENIHFPYDQAEMPMFEKYSDILPIWDMIRNHIPENRGVYRMYVNGYTYGTDAYSHVDENNLSTSDRAETAIVYLNNSWDHDWAGETVLFDDDFEISKAVLPKPGRVLIFSSSTLHAARPVTRYCPVLRLILAIKTFNKDNSSKEIKFLLEKTASVPHGNKTFFEHLFNTAKTLTMLNKNKELCSAGLFHSIYGTEFFPFDSDISRDTVKELIGEYAESLAYEFCTIKNRYFNLMSGTHSYSPEFAKDLLTIEYANLLDQNDGRFNNELNLINEKINLF